MNKIKSLICVLLCVLCIFSLPVASYADDNYENGFSDGRKAVLDELLQVSPYDTDMVKNAFYSGAISDEDVLFLYCELLAAIESKYEDNELLKIISLESSPSTGLSAKNIVDSQDDSSSDIPGTMYILNKNTKKFHYPKCSSVGDMKESNKAEFVGTRDEIVEKGYDPCGRCKP